MIEKNLPARITKFIFSLGLSLTFVYVLLPILTGSCAILNRMSLYLDENGIDPSRYYYTDVEQVKESEQYLRTVLDNK
jgi:hypothetical protein